ncbi:helix-turn-helix transcriptional regulator [Kutzneria sp. NPDC051319]|uniref:helix-turn-helix transcriptional regulator n=1 Tax=Kutzneria sp. NPDC051319 TaxID=3155047 RepID=UPI00343A727B
MANLAQRQELASFLRARRDRLTPLDVGIVPGLRRRTPGLRREEVAQLSGVSVTWYTWLEQARDITVSRQVLDSLARALRMSPAERQHLFSLGGEPLPAERPVIPPDPALQRLIDTLNPNPAYLLDECWDLLAWNNAEVGLIGDPAELAEFERNLIWLVFTQPAMRELLTDWRGQAKGLLAQFRADIAGRTGEPRVEERVAALRRVSPEFREWWDLHAIEGFRSARHRFDHPRLGRLTVDYVRLAALDTPGVKLFTCVPADAATAEKMPGLLSVPAPA